jgi:hypothetical protein
MLSLILFQNVIKIAIMLEINDICKSYMSTPIFCLRQTLQNYLLCYFPTLCYQNMMNKALSFLS